MIIATGQCGFRSSIKQNSVGTSLGEFSAACSAVWYAQQDELDLGCGAIYIVNSIQQTDITHETFDNTPHKTVAMKSVSWNRSTCRVLAITVLKCVIFQASFSGSVTARKSLFSDNIDSVEVYVLHSFE